VYAKLLQRWNDDQEKWDRLAKDRDGFHWELGEGRTAAVTYFGANTTGIEKVVQPTGNTED
jgi:hypothetical protein